MTDTIIVLVILAVLALAVLRGRKHFKGGGCCGSGGNTVIKKKLTAPKLGEKILFIEGMHCENCAARIEDHLNRMEGVACLVNLKKGVASVSYSTEVSDGILKDSVEKLGYKVTSIH